VGTGVALGLAEGVAVGDGVGAGVSVGSGVDVGVAVGVAVAAATVSIVVSSGVGLAAEQPAISRAIPAATRGRRTTRPEVERNRDSRCTNGISPPQIKVLGRSGGTPGIGGWEIVSRPGSTGLVLA
jgi:hypothetical protein